MRFGTWKGKRLYRPGSLKTVGKELAKHNLETLAVQAVRWVECGSKPADVCTFFYGNGNADDHLGTGF
jgi:hypothetical protein